MYRPVLTIVVMWNKSYFSHLTEMENEFFLVYRQISIPILSRATGERKKALTKHEEENAVAYRLISNVLIYHLVSLRDVFTDSGVKVVGSRSAVKEGWAFTFASEGQVA